MATTTAAPVVFERRCKICQLAQTAPDLFKDLHYQVLEVGSSLNRAMHNINNQIDQNGLQIQKFNNQNMSAHFGSHIMLPNKVTTEVNKLLAPGQIPLKEVNHDANTYVEDLVRRRVGNEVSDYLNLDHLRMQLMEKVDFLDSIVTKEGEDGKKYVDLEALSQYTSIIKEIRACIIDLNKIRQSKQLMNMVIKSLIEKSTFETVHKLSREYDQVKLDLRDAGVPEDIIIKVDMNLRFKLAEIVANVARSCIEEITRTYRL